MQVMNVYKLGVKRGGTTHEVVANRSRQARRFVANDKSNVWLNADSTYCKKTGTVERVNMSPTYA